MLDVFFYYNYLYMIAPRYAMVHMGAVLIQFGLGVPHEWVVPIAIFGMSSHQKKQKRGAETHAFACKVVSIKTSCCRVVAVSLIAAPPGT